jgi:hypothetical protein
VQGSVGVAQEAEKSPVDAHQPLSFVEVVETQAESELHAGKIILENPAICLIPKRITLFPSGAPDADQE